MAESNLAELDVSAANNDPAAGGNVSAGDDEIRNVKALLKQALVLASDVASASSVTVPADGNSAGLTGTTTVTALVSTNSWNGRVFWWKHEGTHQFTHSSTLILPDAQNQTLVSGDYTCWIQEATDTWRCIGIFRTSGANLGGRWAVDSNGYLLNSGGTQPTLQAVNSAAVSAATTVFASYTEVIDQGGSFNNTTGVYTCPVVGRYLVIASIEAANTGSGDFVFELRQGTTVRATYSLSPAATGNLTPCLHAIISASASDTISVRTNTWNGTGSAGVRSLSIVLLG